MNFSDCEEKIFQSRSFLLDSCLEISRDIAALKNTSLSKDLVAISELKAQDTSIQNLTDDLLSRDAKLEVADLVKVFSEQFQELVQNQETADQARSKKQIELETNLHSIDAFFRHHDEAQQVKTNFKNQQNNKKDENQSISIAMHLQEDEEVKVNNQSPTSPSCNFELMAKLPGHWNRWTGNIPNHSDLPAIRNASNSKILYNGEVIKIPLKSSIWNRNTASKLVHSVKEDEEEEHNSGNDSSRESPPDLPNTTPITVQSIAAAAIRMSQAQLGSIRYNALPAGTYWSSLSLTECIMAAPFYQHLTSEKFRSLEHFAVLRTFQDKEMVLDYQQRFYNIFFIRQGAIKMFKPNMSHPDEPAELIQILQSGDFFGLESLSPDLSVSSSRFLSQACGDNVQVYALPLEFFNDLLLKDLSMKSLPMRVSLSLDAILGTHPPSSIQLGMYGLAKQELLHTIHIIQTTSTNKFNTIQLKEQYYRNLMTSISRLDCLINPEFSFPEVIDEFLYISKEILSVDRVCLYVIDRHASAMRFFGLSPSPRHVMISETTTTSTTGGSASPMHNTVVGEGIVSTLNGVVLHVAQHATVLNINNFQTHDMYDAAVEKRTCQGKKIKHLLLTPVFDRAGRVAAVLQCSNPKLRDGFTDHDILLSNYVASLVTQLRMPPVAGTFKLLPELGQALTFRLDRLVTDKSNRHLRGTIRLFLGSEQFGPVISTAAVATYPIMGDLRRCDFKQDITITNLPLGSLTDTARLIFAFESTNHHPIVWCGMYLVDYMRMLRQGDVGLIMWDGGVPEDIASMPMLLAGLSYAHGDTYNATVKNPTASKVLQTSGAVLTVHLPELFIPVYHNTRITVKYSLTMGLHDPHAVNPLPENYKVTPVALPEGTTAIAWYSKQMTSSESSIFRALQKIVDVIQPSDIDSETRRLIWRMRNALCAECPWAMLWFVLSCEWEQPARVEEMYRLLYSWARLSPMHAVQLLDHRFVDSKVRAVAVGHLEKLSDSDLQDLLYQLVYVLRYEKHEDNALTRYLLRRGLTSPHTVGKQLVWYLHGAFLADPIVGAQCHRLLKVYLRSLPDNERVHQGHGLYAMTRLDSIYRGLAASDLLTVKSASTKGGHVDSEHVVGLLLGELNQNPWPSEFHCPVPVDCIQHSTGVVECDKLPNMPHSFAFTLKYPELPLSRFVYTLAVSVKVETIYQHMLRAVDFVWHQESIPLSALCYDAFPVGTSGVVQNVLASGKPIASIAARLYGLSSDAPYSGAAGGPSSPLHGSNKGNIRSASVPASLVIDYLRQTAKKSTETANHNNMSRQEKEEAASAVMRSLLNTFVGNIAVHAVLCQVLGLKEVTVFNTIITMEGKVFVQNPSCILNIDALSANTGDVKAHKPSTAISSSSPTSSSNRRVGGRGGGGMIFFPKYFDYALLMENRLLEREFITLLSLSFLSLRKHTAFLVWSLYSLGQEQGVPAAQILDSIEQLKERLLLKMNDEAALNHLKEIIRTSTGQEPSY